jgi:hypothetical protein
MSWFCGVWYIMLRWIYCIFTLLRFLRTIVVCALGAFTFAAGIALPASGQVTWDPWSSVSEGRSMPGAPVTAVPWKNGFALFLADPNGGVYTATGNPQIGWGLWTSVSEGRSAPGGTITAVPWKNGFALFLADPNGGIYTITGSPDAGWGLWTSVSEGRSMPGARVTAIPWKNGFALFLADPNGGVYTATGNPQAGWGPWSSVSEGRSAPGGTITAIPWKNGFALFLADPNGGIYMAAGNPQAGWGPWSSVSEGSSTPGARVAVVPWKNGFALFLADPNGGIYTAAGNPQAGWGPWSSVSEGRSMRGGSITTVPWQDGFALFLADPNGGVYTATGNSQAGWGPWLSVSEGRSAPGGTITAVPWKNGFAVFLADPNGGIYTTASGLSKAMDVVSSNDMTDDNGFLRNPLWRQMTQTGQPPDPCAVCPCGQHDTPVTWNNARNCTDQGLHQNSRWLCAYKATATASGIPYHMNWFPVEYEGTLRRFEKSSSVEDDDYNFIIYRPDRALETAGRGEAGIELEFDSDQTVDHWDGTNTWWDAFHHNFVDTNAPAANDLIRDKNAIVIGMLGLDVAHKDHHSELHPVYAMFVQLPLSPTEDRWAFFVRNWGDEGLCGPGEEPIPQNTIRVRIPQHPGATTFFLSNNISTFSDDDDNKDECRQKQEWSLERTTDGALLTFSLLDASKKCGFVGDFTIDWGTPGTTVVPTPRESGTIPVLREDEDPVLKSKIDRLDPSARQLLYKQLASLTRQPTALRKEKTNRPSPPKESARVAAALPNYGTRLKSVPNPTQTAKKDRKRKFILSFLKAHGIK